MNGDILCNSHSITLLSCNSEKEDEERRPNSTGFKKHDPSAGKEGSCSKRAPCWSDEMLRCSPPELSLPLGNNSSMAHTPLHHHGNNNKSTAHLAHQRRGVRHKVRGKKTTLRITHGKNSQNRIITDYFPMRRSLRKSKAELKCEQKKHIDDLITNGIEEGMEVQHIEGKGRGVFATRCFCKGEYVVEYHGDLLQITDAKKREVEYAQNPTTGCYMYYFQYRCKTYCVDATKETGRKGRLLNHSKNGNCQTKLHEIAGTPHLILVASQDIDEGEELLYDYGDRSKASIAAHPWLKY